MGQLFGGPLDGLHFTMKGFWLARPRPVKEILAEELLVNSQTKSIQPLWQDIADARIVPPRPVAVPYYHYKRVNGIKEYHYEYSGLWEWKEYG